MRRRLLAVASTAAVGGAEVALLRLLRRLGARGWTLTVATPGAGPLRDAATAELGAATATLRVGGLAAGSGRRAVAAWPRARRLAAGADVVLVNGGVAARLLPALRGARARVALHVHDMVDRVPGHWRRADVVLCGTEAVARPLRALGDLEPAVVGYPIELDVPQVRPDWADGGGPLVGFVGRPEPRKGVLDLVRAAPAIRAGAPGARVVLVGNDPLDADPAYRAEVLGAEDVEAVGPVPDAAAVMGALDVLVLPSRREPFGMVLAEAMAAGTPVVATAVDGIPEVVEDGVTGRLVPPGRPDALAAAVLDVLARRDRLGAAARQAARRHGAEAYADRVEPLLLGSGVPG